MRDSRIVITGLGTVTPVGIGKTNFWQALCNGKSGIGTITRVDVSELPVQIGAEVKDFDPTQFVDRKEARRMDRYTQFALAAARLAVEDAELNVEEVDSERFGVFVGSGVGGMETLVSQHNTLLKSGPRRISPFFVPMMISNIAAGQVAIAYKAKGPCSTTVTACATGTHSIGDAFRALQYGEADIALAGGAEAAITPLAIAGFASAKALSTRNDEPEKACRPFDVERDGFIMGEGAGIVVLETLEHAQKRGARIYAEVVGYGRTADAYHITAPAPNGEGAARCIAAAIRDAGIAPEKIGYINAHGTSTPLNDKFETMAIKSVFGSHAQKLAISSTKSMTGHLLGASGAVELIASALAVHEGIVPPTINYENPDPECDLDYVPNEARKIKLDFALSNSFGFGGQNATLVVSRFSG